jgi:hypothetical protein
MSKAVILFLTVSTLSATAKTRWPFHAPWVTCYDEAGKFVGPKKVQTPTLTSPNGKYRARAEIDAQADPVAECANTVRLLVSANGLPERAVFTQGPSLTDGSANSLGPVAWSRDSRWLAVEFDYWFYGSDAVSMGLLLYDSQSDRASTPDPLLPIERALGKGCTVQLRSVVGFEAQGRLRLRIADARDELGEGSHCIRGTADWLYDPVTQGAVPARSR